MHPTEKVAEVLFTKDDVTWQSIIQELIKSGEVDPWDVDIASLTHKYIEVVKQLEAFDFKISGKALLAASLLLRIKSHKLVSEDMAELDRIIAGTPDDDFFEEDILTNAPGEVVDEDQPLIPRLPQPRKRKVSIYDLMGALDKALEVKHRRVLKSMPSYNVHLPTKKPNVNLSIKGVYLSVRKWFLGGKESLTFSQLVPSDSREDKIATFIPLLHLTNRRKVDLHQEEAFSDFGIHLLDTTGDIDKELKDIALTEDEANPT